MVILSDIIIYLQLLKARAHNQLTIRSTAGEINSKINSRGKGNRIFILISSGTINLQ